jgi:hypothetical protein
MEAIKCANCGEILRAGTITCPDCGAAIRVPVETRPPFRRFNWSAAVVVFAGALVILGSWLPWATWSQTDQPGATFSKSGLSGDGIFGLLIGAVVIALGILYLRRMGLPGGRVGVFALGWVSLVGAWYEGAFLASQFANANQVAGHVGVGLYVIGAGGVILAIVSVLGQHQPFRRDLYEPLEQPEE